MTVFPDFSLTHLKFPDFSLTFWYIFKIPWLFPDWKKLSHFSRFSSVGGNPVYLHFSLQELFVAHGTLCTYIFPCRNFSLHTAHSVLTFFPAGTFRCIRCSASPLCSSSTDSRHSCETSTNRNDATLTNVLPASLPFPPPIHPEVQCNTDLQFPSPTHPEGQCNTDLEESHICGLGLSLLQLLFTRRHLLFGTRDVRERAKTEGNDCTLASAP